MGWFVFRPEMGMGYVYPTNSWQGSFGIPSNHCQAWELSSPTEIFAILCYSDWCMLEFDGRTGATKTAAHPDFEVRTLTFLLWKTLRLAVTHLISPQPAPQLCGSSPHWKKWTKTCKTMQSSWSRYNWKWLFIVDLPIENGDFPYVRCSISWKIWVRQWEGWHPLFILENKKCLKPPTRYDMV